MMKSLAPLVGACCLAFSLSTTAWAQHHAPQQHAGPQSASLSASNCWVRLMPAAVPSGGFFVATNSGSEDAVLTGASSPDYAMVMLHETREENGMSKMFHVDKVTVPAGGSLEFKPGSFHIMLEQPRAGLEVGGHVTVVFALENGESFSADCELKSPKSAPGMGAHGAHGG